VHAQAPLVLLVEDDAEAREQLAFLIGRRGWRVRTAADGAQALRQLERGPLPELIILDLMMPVMDGWETRRALEASSTWSRIPVVLLSGIEDIEDQVRALGAVDCLTKPIDLHRLHAVLDRWSGAASARSGDPDEHNGRGGP
jgi:CheY-like chemotaxis protein